MLDEKPNIAATIISRICHDLISPIGAISNGLELLELSGVPQGPEIKLISESAKNASARIRFLRLAFGNIDSGASVSTVEMNDILSGYYSDPRIKLNWSIKAAVARSDLRVLFLLLLCAEKIAPFDVVISVSKHHNGYEVEIKSKGMKTEGFLDFEAHKLLPQDGPSLVQFSFTQTQVDQLQYSLKLEQIDDQVTIKVLT